MEDNLSLSEDEQTDNPAKKRKKGDKKTEPANPFGQFLKQKNNVQKQAELGRFSFKEACEEWKSMDSENKKFYKECYENEKKAMGDDYRARKVHVLESDKYPSISKEKDEGKTAGKKKGSKVRKEVVKANDSIALLSTVKSLDSEIDKFSTEETELQEMLSEEKTQLAITQFKLGEKISEYENINDKYKTLLGQHSSCQI